MSSKYNSIKTAADLVAEVYAHGLSTAQDDINRAADIFGRTSIEELDRLANDIGRNNDKGEPDPDGSWSSSRRATQATFYQIAFNIWHWEQATRFFNQHTNPETKGRRLAKLEAALGKTESERDALQTQLYEAREAKTLADRSAGEAQRRAEEMEAEVTKLKAKLYDHMSKEEQTA